MINPLADLIDVARLREIQARQYSERLLMAGTVPATGEIRARTAVSNLGDFLCLHWTGAYTTLNLVGGNVVDSSVVYLSGRLLDGGSQRQLFSDFIPFNLLFSPGRQRSDAVTFGTPDPVTPLIYPMEFPYLFKANTEIQMDVRNTSAQANLFAITFYGIRIKG